MGNTIAPQRSHVPDGKTRICVAGIGISHNVGRAQKLVELIAREYPNEYESWFYFSTFGYKTFVQSILEQLPEDQKKLRSTKDENAKTMENHTSAPFCWLEWGDGTVVEAIGGRDMLCEWARNKFSNNELVQELAAPAVPALSEMFFDNTSPAGTSIFPLALTTPEQDCDSETESGSEGDSSTEKESCYSEPIDEVREQESTSKTYMNDVKQFAEVRAPSSGAVPSKKLQGLSNMAHVKPSRASTAEKKNPELMKKSGILVNKYSGTSTSERGFGGVSKLGDDEC